MANNSGRTKKSHNYKPYDTSNSFVKRITAKVSEILPQPSSWVSRLFSPAPKLNVRGREDLEEEDEEEEERQPPSKRICFGPPGTGDYTHQNNINRINDLERESGEISPIPNSRFEDTAAVAGPSGLQFQNLVSSTPAVPRQVTIEATPSQKLISSTLKRAPPSDSRANTSKKNLNLSLSTSNTLSSATQPVFDTYVFKNPLNKSGLRPRSSLNESCFYPGETTYGGASARSWLAFEPPKARVVSVTASPTTQRDTIGTSAQRILKALEQFSTPVLDAKRIPVRGDGNRGLKRRPPQPYEELIVPTMPELLSLKRREVVSKPPADEAVSKPSASEENKPSTSAAAASAPSVSKPTAPPPSAPVLTAPGSTSASLIAVSSPATLSTPSSTTTSSYSLRPESAKDKHIGSIKGRQNDGDIETERVPELKLPNVQLKITSLPKFDLGCSQEVKPSTSTTVKTKPETVVSSSPKFMFSEPEVLDSEKILPNLHVNMFKFSEPLDSLDINSKTTLPTIVKSNSANETPKAESTLKMRSPSPNFKLKRKSTEVNDKAESIKNVELKMPSELKTGSIMDAFNKNPYILLNENKLSSENSLKCNKCNSDKKDCKCATSSKEHLSQAKSSLATDDQWECKNCHSKNISSAAKCNKCGLGKGVESLKMLQKGFEGYKKPTNKWECKECFVSNDNSIDTCVSCSTPKAGKSTTVVTQSTTAPVFTFSASGNKPETLVSKTSAPFAPLVNSIKKPQGTWKCDGCWVDNKPDTTVCVSCSTPKPGAALVEQPKPTFSFGIPAASSVETKGFQFGVNANTKEHESKDSAIKESTFTFGNVSDDKKTQPIFKFGSDQKNDSIQKNTNAAFPPTVNSLKKPSDKWTCETCLIQNGNDLTSCEACSTPKPGSIPVEKAKPSFSFGVSSTNFSSTNNVQFGSSLPSQKSESTPVQQQFSFGNQPDEKKNSNSMFKFGSNDTKFNSDSSKPAFGFMNSDKPLENDVSKPPASNLFSFGTGSKSEDKRTEDDKPPKKKVSFGKPLVSEKHITNDTHSSLFGSALSTKSNDIGTANFMFNSNSSLEKNETVIFKEPAKEPIVNSVFSFGNADTNTKPAVPDGAKHLGLSSTTGAQVNSEPQSTNSIFGGVPFGGFNKPEDNKPGFGFMNSSQPAPPAASGAQTGGFTFNASSTPQPDATPFSQATPAQPALFGGQQEQPKPFMFGASQNQQPVFTFTATPQQSGGIGGNTPAFGSFAPTANTNPTPQPMFDPNAKPSFNFTGGATPSFSASAATNAVAEGSEKRRVRKAIRRTTQHR